LDIYLEALTIDTWLHSSGLTAILTAENSLILHRVKEKRRENATRPSCANRWILLLREVDGNEVNIKRLVALFARSLG
jgi:hypothetical protein